VPRLSVLLPVYQGGVTLAEAIGSLLAQRFRDFEVQVIDDGSTDLSAEIADAFAADDSRVKVLRRSHGGHTRWLQQALENSTSELIARMDADDIARPERFEKQIAYLDAHPECVALGADALRVDPVRRPLGRLGVAQDHAAIDTELLRGRGDALLHPLAMMRREALRAVGGYRPETEPGEDLDLFLRLAEHGRLANLPDVLLEYRQHLSKVSSTRKREQQVAQDAVLREARERRGLPPAPPRDEAAVPERLDARDHFDRWARFALEGGYPATARRYAFAAWRRAPASPRALRLVVRSVLGIRHGTIASWRRRFAGLRPSRSTV
jgi:glycosyltransferase involved in cell wall biosynthesis